MNKNISDVTHSQGSWTNKTHDLWVPGTCKEVYNFEYLIYTFKGVHYFKRSQILGLIHIFEIAWDFDCHFMSYYLLIEY